MTKVFNTEANMLASRQRTKLWPQLRQGQCQCWCGQDHNLRVEAILAMRS